VRETDRVFVAAKNTGSRKEWACVHVGMCIDTMPVCASRCVLPDENPKERASLPRLAPKGTARSELGKVPPTRIWWT
jgi:hypothetical protein